MLPALEKWRLGSGRLTSRRMETDVLVIGGGCAAARAALEARAAGAEVLVVVKGAFGRCGATAFRVSDIGSFSIADGCRDPEDGPEHHFQETMDAGMGVCNPALVRVLAEDAPRVISDFERLGIPFMEENGKHLLHVACFGRRPRMHIVEGFGYPVLAKFRKEIENRNILILSHTLATDLAVRNNRCVGALALDHENQAIAIEAGSTILATGGAGQLFLHTLYPSDLTGDGYGMALRAGVDLVNMEFMQMGIGLATPKLLLGNWVWALQPKAVNRAGEPILLKYLPANVSVEECMEDKSKHWPFSVEHLARHIDIAIFRESGQQAVKKEHTVFLDARNQRDKIREDHPLLGMRFRWLLNHGVDIRSNPVAVRNYSHSFGGGVRIDSLGRSSLPGLYAAGEAAGGMHGANRVGGNMLLACQVFGARAGRNAAQEALGTRSCIPAETMDQLLAAMNEMRGKGKRESLPRIRKRIQNLFQAKLMVIRNQKWLQEALDGVRELREDLRELRTDRPRDLKQLLELRNLLDVGEVVAASALRRRESRGSHYREDFPNRDERLSCPVIVRSEAGCITLNEARPS